MSGESAHAQYQRVKILPHQDFSIYSKPVEGTLLEGTLKGTSTGTLVGTLTGVSELDSALGLGIEWL